MTPAILETIAEQSHVPCSAFLIRENNMTKEELIQDIQDRCQQAVVEIKELDPILFELGLIVPLITLKTACHISTSSLEQYRLELARCRQALGPYKTGSYHLIFENHFYVEYVFPNNQKVTITLVGEDVPTLIEEISKGKCSIGKKEEATLLCNL